MAKFDITIEEVHPLIDGEYEIVLPFKAKELNWVKRISGLRPREFAEAYEQGDYDLAVAWAVVALHRAGKIAATHPWESVEAVGLMDADAGTITVASFDAEEDDAGPPEMTPSDAGESTSDVEKTPSSGNGSGSSSDQPETIRPPSGSPISEPAASA